MKIRFCAALLLAALALPLFAGCAANAAQLDTAKDFVENRLDRAEDALESRIEAAAAEPVLTPELPAPATEAAAPAPEAPASAATEAALLTKEEAEKIALEHAGVTAEQVTRLRTALDYDRGRPEYDVDFHVDRVEYDYEIDAQTGRILDWDRDLDD